MPHGPSYGWGAARYLSIWGAPVVGSTGVWQSVHPITLLTRYAPRAALSDGSGATIPVWYGREGKPSVEIVRGGTALLTAFTDRRKAITASRSASAIPL